jgi:hypothetical protein
MNLNNTKNPVKIKPLNESRGTYVPPMIVQPPPKYQYNYQNEGRKMKSSTETLIKALHILSKDIKTDDGIANAALTEAAYRMEELHTKNIKMLDMLKECMEFLSYPRDGSEIGDMYCDIEDLINDIEKE